MENHVILYLISRDAQVLFCYDLLTKQEMVQSARYSSFITNLKQYIQLLGSPKGISLVRVENLEARFWLGNWTYPVLLIDTETKLGFMTESILQGLIMDIGQQFETDFEPILEQGKATQKYPTKWKFAEKINEIVEKYWFEAFEIYQKLILTEALNARVAPDVIEPLIERVSEGEDVIEDIKALPSRWQERIKSVVNQVNYGSNVILDLFGIPKYVPE